MLFKRIDPKFFLQDALVVAPELLGKVIVRDLGDGNYKKFSITEVEAYRGEEDLASHASKGRTKRTEVMYAQGGLVYVYLIYGMHWMLNFVTGPTNCPQALLIRGLNTCNGPGRVARELKIDGTFYGENLLVSKRIWVEDSQQNLEYMVGPRIGVDYSGPCWASKPWRFWSVNNNLGY